MDAQVHLNMLLPNWQSIDLDVAIRMRFPFLERAVALHPERFVSLRRVDHRDPELERLVAEVRSQPGALCLRVVPIVDTGEVDAFERGEFEALFAAAETHGVPIFASLPGRGQMLARGASHSWTRLSS